jgi:excinuclease ABC subunit A
MNKEFISIEGAKVHNLKDVTVQIPKNKLVVVCGVSGSGKSSLAFDTLYEEGQRRYLEGLSSYVRQFLGGFKKPDVDKIVGLSPTLAINQKSVSSNPRSTVGTITEIYDHLRLLFARAGKPYCPNDNIPITAQTPQEITQKIIQKSESHEAFILAPVVQGKKGEHRAVLQEIERSGYGTVRMDGLLYPVAEALGKNLDKNKAHTIEVVVGRFMSGLKIATLASRARNDKGGSSKAEKEALKKRNKKLQKIAEDEKLELVEKVRKALHMGGGQIVVLYRTTVQSSKSKVQSKEFEEHYSELFSCPKCGFSLPKIEPRLFSFNSPFGACQECQGLGTKLEIDEELLISPDISIEAGAILPWFTLSQMSKRALGANWQRFVTTNILEQHGVPARTPFKKIPEHVQKYILYGDKSKELHVTDGDWEGKTYFEGVIPRLERLYYETDSEFIRHELSKYMTEKPCPVCKGARLRQEALAVRFGGKNISQIADIPVKDVIKFFGSDNKLSESEKKISAPIIKEIIAKATFLEDVGLEYITVGRSATTLSVGENQRIRLATQLGSGLSGVIYVLDEPTIGLHPQDTERLIKTLKYLRDLQNTVVVVEHDERVIEEADWIIEIGPRAGVHGGKLVFSGTPQQLKKSKTLTGEYLSGRRKVSSDLPKNTKEVNPNDSISVRGASQFNLKKVSLNVPLRRFTVVAGISGSGKSTLVLDVFSKAIQKEVMRMPVVPGAYERLENHGRIDKIVIIDQSPIGKTPRSNPATYTGLFTPIRQLYARLEESQVRGYGPSHFSFNVKPGRCEACKGEGFKKVEMYFLPDMYVECEVCKGTRFSPEVLDVKYDGKSIADVLDMSVQEAYKFFEPFSQISDKLKLLDEIGLGYMKLGQSATTLSGGEAQRIKLAEELSKRHTTSSLYVLDEPTVGLHFDDTKRLLQILRSLVLKGNTVVVIEHNLDVIKEADWMIELGPKGGGEGGKIVYEGKVGDAKKKKTATGKYL